MTLPLTRVFSPYVQVQDCIQQNNELRAMLNQLRLEQSSMIAATDAESSGVVEAHAEGGGPGSWMAERTKLKVRVPATFIKVNVLEGSIYLQEALTIRDIHVFELQIFKV